MPAAAPNANATKPRKAPSDAASAAVCAPLRTACLDLGAGLLHLGAQALHGLGRLLLGDAGPLRQDALHGLVVALHGGGEQLLDESRELGLILRQADAGPLGGSAGLTQRPLDDRAHRGRQRGDVEILSICEADEAAPWAPWAAVWVMLPRAPNTLPSMTLSVLVATKMASSVQKPQVSQP